MRPIVSLITALAVNLHLVLGCCAHHAHGKEGVPCQRHEHGQRPVRSGCNHAHHGSHDHAAPPTNSADPILPTHNDCHESHCTFMLAAVKTFSPDLVVAFVDLPVGPTASELAPLRGVSPRDRGDPFELAVRTHLLHQNLLN